MNIRRATEDYEEWLGKQLVNRGGLDKSALKKKHQVMKGKDHHPFVRATFYRWASLWIVLRKKEQQIDSVGDIHVENFGTWRRKTGKPTLVWGVNDFDESCMMPWMSDLVRLGVSATFAIRELKDSFDLSPKRACLKMLKSYTDALTREPDTSMAFELQYKNDPFCRLVKKMLPGSKQLEEEFFIAKKHKWAKLDAQERQNVQQDCSDALSLLSGSLPQGNNYALWRPKPDDPVGLGSLGKRRYYALVNHGFLIYEVKPAIASACEWAKGTGGQNADTKLLKSSRRVPDPSQDIKNGWIVRRRGSDAQKLELDKFERNRDAKKEALLFTNMAIELANLHRTNSKKKIEAVVTDLKQRNKKDPDWFLKLVAKWVKKMENDHKKFKKG
jgi:uncharacterized protein (DUF2252 family)